MISKPMPMKEKPVSKVFASYESFDKCRKWFEQKYDIDLEDIGRHKRWLEKRKDIWRKFAVEFDLDVESFIKSVSDYPHISVERYVRYANIKRLTVDHLRNLVDAIGKALVNEIDFKDNNPEPKHLNYILYLENVMEMEEGCYFWIERTDKMEPWINTISDLIVSEFAIHPEDDKVQFYKEWE